MHDAVRINKLAKIAADHGNWEEFYQKCSRDPQSLNYQNGDYMRSYHKERRLEIEQEIRNIKDKYNDDN